MNKKEFLEIVEKLNFPKDQYCIISGGSMMMYSLKDYTEDVDLKIKPDLYNKLKEKYTLVPSKKMDDLYELGENIELRVENFEKEDIEFIDGFPVLSLEKQREWIIENKRKKDEEKLLLIDNYLKGKKKLL